MTVMLLFHVETHRDAPASVRLVQSSLILDKENAETERSKRRHEYPDHCHGCEYGYDDDNDVETMEAMN